MANKIAATAALEDDKAGSKQANKQTKVLSFAGWLLLAILYFVSKYL